MVNFGTDTRLWTQHGLVFLHRLSGWRKHCQHHSSGDEGIHGLPHGVSIQCFGQTYTSADQTFKTGPLT